MSGDQRKGIKYLPSTAVFITAGVLAAATIGVGVAWAVEKNKDDSGSTPTPVMAVGSRAGVQEVIDITAQVGLQPSINQNDDGSVWGQDTQGQDTSATFSLNTPPAGLSTFKVKTHSGVEVVQVDAGGGNSLDSIEYRTSNLSDNTNGYIFNDVSDGQDRVTSFIIPFLGNTCSFGSIYTSGGNPALAFGLGFTDGEMYTYESTNIGVQNERNTGRTVRIRQRCQSFL